MTSAASGSPPARSRGPDTSSMPQLRRAWSDCIASARRAADSGPVVPGLFPPWCSGCARPAFPAAAPWAFAGNFALQRADVGPPVRAACEQGVTDLIVAWPPPPPVVRLRCAPLAARDRRPLLLRPPLDVPPVLQNRHPVGDPGRMGCSPGELCAKPPAPGVSEAAPLLLQSLLQNSWGRGSAQSSDSRGEHPNCSGF